MIDKQGPRQRIGKYIGLWVKVESGVGVGLLILMGVVVLWGMFVRYLPIGGAASLWTEEGARLSFVWFVFLAAIRVQRLGAHYKLSLLPDHIGPKGRFWLGIMESILMIIILLVLVVSSILYCVQVLPLVTLNMQWPAIIFALPALLGTSGMVVHAVSRLLKSLGKVQRYNRGLKC